MKLKFQSANMHCPGFAFGSLQKVGATTRVNADVLSLYPKVPLLEVDDVLMQVLPCFWERQDLSAFKIHRIFVFCFLFLFLVFSPIFSFCFLVFRFSRCFYTCSSLFLIGFLCFAFCFYSFCFPQSFLLFSCFSLFAMFLYLFFLVFG